MKLEVLGRFSEYWRGWGEVRGGWGGLARMGEVGLSYERLGRLGENERFDEVC